MTLLWTSDALVQAMGGRPFGTLPAGVTGISIDSRSLNAGDAFFAIKGDAMDGHDFATAAVKAGAAVLVVAEGRLAGLGRLTAPMVVVPDVLVALEKLGIAARKRTTAKVIAVTGSVGKTSTKEALRHTLSTVGTVHASDKSFNNHWGVPLTLARLPQDTDYAVFEIGMNHPDEIRPLVKMVRPHVAIITLIAAAHLGFFRNLDEIAKAKAEIFEGIEPGGSALLNRDDPRANMLGKMARAAGVEHVYGFGENARSTYRLLQCVLHVDHSTITAKIGGREIVARIGAAGRHMVQNALAVLGAAHLVGADVPAVAMALGDLSAEAGRGKRYRLRHPKGTITLIDESYNANPASMQAALSLLQAAPVGEGGRRVAVLGDMLELGEHSAKLHAALAGPVKDAGVQVLLLAGPHMQGLADALSGEVEVVYQPTADDLKPKLMAMVEGGDTVVVKSSKGIGFSRLIDALLKKFPADAPVKGQG
ncbi:UDP-N-acetylmuramoylalanyl-D-glutamyl-2, 6-diaminopimelate--D-alanyl-D-alanine ligase [Mesorhizobium sp. Root554]|uniref:UDP-N-acetylmuramoylalanyl-D-glutamyl-2, 6-diaminopimelate--D-alanyl-D-alanine ligase n=1 Tax=unclassified Mesorhizobium TaxID=325217 RepID=UPI0006F306FF|nr:MULTISPECIES: UDP-N-acetylmuramoylalanyl-D-glutamyl-2,6-diaminopimelate--D-alanyl-D-alanine ligase [unclassified Mesorhizobium]KQZ14048.1 UDP-N-acetylmuramoylalanyl-D-glutamyl-2, 6-diaminopimelate--D-alanyl-D-alanine ligase [Mesorhizobium sp. Root1471]KQZ36560.1 UDP-N-acetylmuramoylalanyl-D-glutamyl-2, 6-diaminopimelate--D-alanyl-D-alanine ligase [Mesorhizobium sp. Root554]